MNDVHCTLLQMYRFSVEHIEKVCMPLKAKKKHLFIYIYFSYLFVLNFKIDFYIYENYIKKIGVLFVYFFFLH